MLEFNYCNNMKIQDFIELYKSAVFNYCFFSNLYYFIALLKILAF